jgi:hypothetical protein
MRAAPPARPAQYGTVRVVKPLLNGHFLSRRSRVAPTPSPLSPVRAATSFPPERTFPEMLELAEAVVLKCMVDTGGHGVLSSAFKSKFLEQHGFELQLTFSDQRVRLKDILDFSHKVEVAMLNTQPVYRYKGGLRAAVAADLAAREKAAAKAAAALGGDSGSGAAAPFPSARA